MHIIKHNLYRLYIHRVHLYRLAVIIGEVGVNWLHIICEGRSIQYVWLHHGVASGKKQALLDILAIPSHIPYRRICKQQPKKYSLKKNVISNNYTHFIHLKLQSHLFKIYILCRLWRNRNMIYMLINKYVRFRSLNHTP